LLPDGATRIGAANDTDLDCLHDDPEFQKLVGLSEWPCIVGNTYSPFVDTQCPGMTI